MSPSEPAALPVLREPVCGVPDVIDTPEALARAINNLAQGAGPIAVDTERAHAFRYSARAYLIQLRREKAGTFIIDPVAFPEGGLADLQHAIAPIEWVLHAASQDLPCLIDLGLVPKTIFDTELAGQLLGLPRVGLAALIERFLGVTLTKEHSAENWSTRPLPREWLAYAALDVEFLTQLRDLLSAELAEAGRAEWASQEFAQVRDVALHPPRPRPDPWRRTSGIHEVRTRLGLGLVRELWTARDAIARTCDLAPGKILQDQAISALAALITRENFTVPDVSAMRHIEGFTRRRARRYEREWVAALTRTRKLDVDALPDYTSPHVGPPPVSSWAKQDPSAWARWQKLRFTVASLAEALGIRPDNLIHPNVMRRLLWEPPSASPEAVDRRLAALGARAWQRDLLASLIASDLA